MKKPQLYQYAVFTRFAAAAVAHAENEAQALELCDSIGIYNGEIFSTEGVPFLPSKAKKPYAKRWNFNG